MGCLLLPFRLIFALLLFILALPILAFLFVLGLVLLIFGISTFPIMTAIVVGICTLCFATKD